MISARLFSPALSAALLGTLVIALEAQVSRADIPEVAAEIVDARLQGDDFVVTSIKDSGPGTLRQAIEDASHASPKGSVITFAPGVNGRTITLGTGELLVPSHAPPIEITAAGLPDGVTISAAGSSRVFRLSTPRTVHLANLTIADGKAADPAGARSDGEGGGGILSECPLYLVDCRIIDNIAGDGGNQGGRGGVGGGIFQASNAGLTLIRCTISGNRSGNSTTTSGGDGGGIDLNGPLRAVDTTISDNGTGSGSASVADNGAGWGGGIHVRTGSVDLYRCTVSGNQVGPGGSGGGLSLEISALTAKNSTIAENLAGENGGGIADRDSLSASFIRLVHCTLADNEATNGNGGGIHLLDGSGFSESTVLELENTIIANNEAPGHDNLNLFVTYSTTGGAGFIGDTPLATLGDYGGYTQTMPPIPGVSDAGIFRSAATAFVPRVDQRGKKRLAAPSATPGDRNDIGAVEVSVDCHLMARLMMEQGARVLTVTRTSDKGNNSLRTAIDAANDAGAEGAVIVFSQGMRGKTVELTSGQLELTNTLGKTVIIGAYVPSRSRSSTAPVVPVELHGGVEITGTHSSRIFDVLPGADAVLCNLTIKDGQTSGGNGPGNGGGIRNLGGLLLRNCKVTGNRSSDGESGGTGARGGGISNNDNGSLVILDSIISHNTAGSTTGLDGGHGGGLFNRAKCVVAGSTVEGNVSGDAQEAGRGGGIFEAFIGELLIFESTISGNRTGSATSVKNQGGGVFTQGLVTIENSTISGNATGEGGSANRGGGIYSTSAGQFVLTNCTLSENTAEVGGAAYNSNILELAHVTVAGNTAEVGGGIFSEANKTLRMLNTIVADNDAISDPNLSGSITDESGVNRVQDGALLAPLGEFGGPTATMPPLPDSPVLDMATGFADLAIDQIGGSRTADAGPDIGAVERTQAVIEHISRAVSPPLTTPRSVTGAGGFFSGAVGRYEGILTHPETGKAVGTMTARLSSGGGLSMSITLSELDVRTSFRANLASNGIVSGILTVRGIEHELLIGLAYTEGIDSKFKLVGRFGRRDETEYSISLDRSGFHSKSNPAPMAGSYTALLPASLVPGAPGGDGYGLVDVNLSGQVKFSGALGDGTKFSVSGIVSENGEWRLFKELYRSKPRGSIGGVVTFDAIDGVSDFSGSLSWMKMADSRESLYPGGFSIESLDIIGSLYTAPASNQAILASIIPSEPNNAIFEVSRGNVDFGPTWLLDWNERNRVTVNGLADGQRFRITPSTGSGLVRGSYSDRFSNARISFAGVAFQKQEVIAGHFPGDGESGFFAIRANGRGELSLKDRSGFDVEGVTADFGDVGTEGGQVIPGELHIVNAGNGNLSVSKFEFPGDAFHLINASPRVLGPGQRMVCHFVFAPSTLGPHESSITVHSDVGSATTHVVGNGIEGNAGQSVPSSELWRGTNPTDRPPEPSIVEADSFSPTQHSGTYEGIAYADEAGQSIAGSVNARISSRGSVSGTAHIGGVIHRFRGAMAGATFDGTTDRGLSISFQIFDRLGLHPGGNSRIKLIGNLDSDHYRFVLVRNGFERFRTPNEMYEGKFTLLMPASDFRGDDTPKGHGYGTTTIRSNGRTRSTFVLGDGTKASHSGFITRDGEWFIYRELYRSRPEKGFIAGRLLFREQPGISAFDGELQWVKRADPREKMFPFGFEIRQLTLGSVYTPAASRRRAFDGITNTSGNFELFFVDADIPTVPFVTDGNWPETSDRLELSPADRRQRFSIRVNSRSGLVTGTFIDSGRGVRVRFGGVIFEEQLLLTGHFIGEHNTGVFAIEVAP